MATLVSIPSDQRNEEWRRARCGKVTGSCIDAVFAKGKTKGTEAVTRANYKAQIIAEALTGQPCGSDFLSRPMQWGVDQEPFARAAYEIERGFLVETVMFVDHPRIENFGCSPDGFVGNDGLVQFKCPNTATHIAYLLSGEIPAEYQSQMLVEMACTGRQWCDFVSFDPRLPPDLQLFVRRFQRDNARISEIELGVQKFLTEVREMMTRLACQRDLMPALELSLQIAQEKRKGPQPVVAILDARTGDELTI